MMNGHHHHHHKAVYFAPMMANDMRLGFTDKRNRNPNWTDNEISRFLEILQEEKVLKDLMAQRNKQVFCYVAQLMTTEGSEKTWDQCRIKLKNLKSQYRYVKDRIPNIDQVDLEDDEVLKQLIAECQGRGISPSNIKHLRYLRRFLHKTSDIATGQLKTALEVRAEVGLGPASFNTSSLSASASTSRPLRLERSFLMSGDPDERLVIDDGESVSPPTSPISSGIRIINDKDDSGEPSAKKKRRECSSPAFGDFSELLSGNVLDGYKFIEKFNRDMMDQFLEYQNRSSASYIRWEQERYRQEQLAVEQWRQEAREQEKQMFGIFCSAISHCNAALNILLKAKQDAQQEASRAKAESTATGAGSSFSEAKSSKDSSDDTE